MTNDPAPVASPARAPAFDATFRAGLADLIAWRRDVRRFLTDPVPQSLVDRVLDLACLAPSVGNSQPWRFVRVDEPARRQAVKRNFERCNAEALAGQPQDRRTLYARLKLDGLDQAPVHLAIFCDQGTAQGHGLGAGTMPEALHYSVVTAIHTLWIAARAEGLGVGWLSILEPATVARDLDTPPDWQFIAYLCVGWPVEEHTDPELVRHRWQDRTPACRRVLQR